MQRKRHELTVSAIFPRALPAAARVEVRSVVAGDGAKVSVVCFFFAGARAGLLAEAPLPAFRALSHNLSDVRMYKIFGGQTLARLRDWSVLLVFELHRRLFHRRPRHRSRPTTA
jgi:hypothetical protein